MGTPLRSKGISLLEMLCVLSMLGVLCLAGMHASRLYTEHTILYVSKTHIEHAVAYARNQSALRKERLHLALESQNTSLGLSLRRVVDGAILRHWSWPGGGLRLAWAGLGAKDGPDFYPEPYVWNSNGQYRLCDHAKHCDILLISKLGRIRTLKQAKPDGF